jgi:hypothetical protein
MHICVGSWSLAFSVVKPEQQQKILHVITGVFYIGVLVVSWNIG